MLAAKQPDLLSMFTGQTYVCFREDEDTFFAISFHPPQESNASTAIRGVVKYHRFKQGVSDDFRKITGAWKNDDNQPTFTSTADSKLPPAEQPEHSLTNEASWSLIRF